MVIVQYKAQANFSKGHKTKQTYILISQYELLPEGGYFLARKEIHVSSNWTNKNALYVHP